MKGRACRTIALVATITGMAPASSLEAMASNETESGWQVVELGTLCVVSQTSANSAKSDLVASIEYGRSYHPAGEHSMRLRMPLANFPPEQSHEKISIRLEGNDATMGTGDALADKTGPGAMVYFALTQAGIDQFTTPSDAETTLVVESTDGELGKVTLAMPRIDRAVLDACFARVGARLRAARRPGYSPDGHPHPPIPREDPQIWISLNDYPSISLQEKEEGRVAVRLLITPYGFIRECKIAESSGFPALDEATCRHFSYRGLFYPAVNSADQAVEGSYLQPVIWTIPE